MTSNLTTALAVAQPAANLNGLRQPADLLVSLAGLSDRSLAVSGAMELTSRCLASSGRGLDLTQANLAGLDLAGFDLRHATLNRASLFGTSLAGADLSGASMVCAGIERTDFTGAKLNGAYVHAMAAQASKFHNADLSGLVDSTGALFHGCDLTGARLDRSMLAGTTFYQCDFADATVTSADLSGCHFNECRLEGANLSRSRLGDAILTRCVLTGLSLEHAAGAGLVVQRPTAADGLRLAHAHLPALRLVEVRSAGLMAAALHAPGIDVDRCVLPEADFASGDFSHGRWRNSTIDHANLNDTALAGSMLSGVSAVEVLAENATGEDLTAVASDFSGGKLAGFTGRYATFRNCNMRSIDLRGAYLYRASIMGDPPTSACLRGAVLDGANLTQAYLAADLTGASIQHGWATYARINQAILADADLRGTGLFRASAVKTDFTAAQLGGQHGLFFADRCVGLSEALLSSADPRTASLCAAIDGLSDLLRNDPGKST